MRRKGIHPGSSPTFYHTHPFPSYHKTIDDDRRFSYAVRVGASIKASALQSARAGNRTNKGMQERVGQNRGELVRAQLDLREFETELEHLRGLLAERRSERQLVDLRIQEIAATGDMDKLVTLQSRAVAIERNVAELSAAETECAHRVESARRYLYTLYVRLEKLRQEFSRLMQRVASVAHGETLPSDVLTNLGRVKIQLKAITGENSTGRL